MRLFDTPGADGAYDRWLDPIDRGHDEACNCRDCHEWHKENFLVEKNAECKDFDCCKAELGII